MRHLRIDAISRPRAKQDTRGAKRTPRVARARFGRRPVTRRRAAGPSHRAAPAVSTRVSRKPNSVGLLRGDHLSGAPVAGRLGATDPGVVAERDTLLPLYAVLLQVGFTEPAPSPGPRVRYYRTVSPLPAAHSPPRDAEANGPLAV